MKGDVRALYEPQILRLMDNILPKNLLAQHSNPVLQKLSQIPQFGWHSCTPQHLGNSLRLSFANIHAPELLEHAANAKRWIHEHLITYIDGKLPVWLRKPKFILDVIKILQYAARVVATVSLLISIIEKEIALANAYIDKAIALVNFAKSTLSPPGLRTFAEQELSTILDHALLDLPLQKQMNGQTLQCLI